MTPTISITSSVQPRKVSTESSTLLSAHHLYAAITGHLPRTEVPILLEKASPDSRGHLDPEKTAKLFHRLWQLAKRFRGLDLELDMSGVGSVSDRFVRELAFFRRHLRQSNRRISLSQVRSECSHLTDIV